MRDFIIATLQMAKKVALKTETKIDDFVIDLVLSNPNLINTIAQIIDTQLGIQEDPQPAHNRIQARVQSHAEIFKAHGIDINQIMVIVQLILSIWNQLKK